MDDPLPGQIDMFTNQEVKIDGNDNGPSQNSTK